MVLCLNYCCFECLVVFLLIYDYVCLFVVVDLRFVVLKLPVLCNSVDCFIVVLVFVFFSLFYVLIVVWVYLVLIVWVLNCLVWVLMLVVWLDLRDCE